MKHLRMELKVCEGCGVLWLRPGQETKVYCPRCTAKLAEFPAARGRRGSRGPRTRHPAAGTRAGLRVVGGQAVVAARMAGEGAR